MLLRLAFSVATHCDADVLIVDEALAVGDGYFQKKSVDRITEFQRRGGTLLFCSHALYYVALLCDRAIWLKNGEAAAQGDALTVVRAYETFLQEKERRDATQNSVEAPRRPHRRTAARTNRGGRRPRRVGLRAHGVRLRGDGRLRRRRRDPTIRVSRCSSASASTGRTGVQVLAVDTREEPWAPLTGGAVYRVRLTLPRLPIAQGEFRVYVYLGDEKALHVHD